MRILALWGACAAAIIGAIVWCCQGRFILALDDPYIHLSVAHNLIGGHYGINADEASSPSSSILWPWLLTLTEALHLGALGPLALGLAAAAGSLWVGLRLLRATNVIDVEAAPREAAAVAVVFIFIVSALGLPFTGLEHSAHVFASLLTLEALALASAGRAPSLVHVMALAALPLLRFEGLALFLAAIAALAGVGRRREAALAAALATLGLALYGALVWRLGLPWLPSSVLAKSNLTTSLGVGPDAFLAALGHKLIADVVWGRAPALLAMAAALIWIVRQPAGRARAPLHLAVAAVLAGHLAFGAYGWFGRYEVYAVAIGALATLMGLADIFAAPGRPLLARSAKPAAGKKLLSLRPNFVAMALLLTLAAPYAAVTVLTPAAAANVYGVQYQLRRLAQEFYPRPVAVNDIGLVSWGNPHYVLDLWGLGSEAARKLRNVPALGPEAMRRLADQRDVELVMIYDYWFPNRPASWRKIGELDVEREIVTGRAVSVYLTPKGDRAVALSALKRLSATLPPGTTLKLMPDAGLADDPPLRAPTRPAG